MSEFKRQFREKYWSESTQNMVRNNLSNGRYETNVGQSPTSYFLGKVCMARNLEPRIPEECLVIQLSYHYEEGIKNARMCSQIKTIPAMAKFLENYEHETHYQRNRVLNSKYHKYNGNDQQTNSHSNDHNQPTQNVNTNRTQNNHPNNNQRNYNYRVNNHYNYRDSRNNRGDGDNRPNNYRHHVNYIYSRPQNNQRWYYPRAHQYNNYYNQSRREYNYQNERNYRTTEHNTEAVSYTHLDVYKRQDISIEQINRIMY